MYNQLNYWNSPYAYPASNYYRGAPNNYYGQYQNAHYYHRIPIQDYGQQPYVVNIDEATKQNNTFRTALWTGDHLQVTLMSIPVGGDIGLEIHPDTDQFLRLEAGQGLVLMGDSPDNLNFQQSVYDGYAIMIPAGKWHNLINMGNQPIKLYSIYAPPHHPFGTVHQTQQDAIDAEEDH